MEVLNNDNARKEVKIAVVGSFSGKTGILKFKLMIIIFVYLSISSNCSKVFRR